jgi:acyl-CoA dehydrogenase
VSQTTATSDLEALRERTRRFIHDVVIPAEPEEGAHGIDEALRRRLQEQARDHGVFAPHAPAEYGGRDLDVRGQTVIFEEAGRSLLGPIAINAAAPDEGNIHLLDQVADTEQRDRYLRPLAKGEVRSCFAMTEPSPGAGSDPSALRTTATRDGDGWVLDGRKWYITGADGAAFAIVMARTSPIEGRRGATMFLVDTSTPGWRIERQVGSLDVGFAGGHAEVVLEGCRVPSESVLGEVDLGFEYAQVRLEPARLTHCMRWLGIARRSQDLALARARERELFGERLGALGMAQQLLADNEIDLAASHGLVRAAAEDLDAGRSAKQATSIAKTFVSEAVHRVVDRSIQLCGSLGVSDDLPLGRYLREVRPFRIYDGPSETHRWAIARRALRAAAPNDRGPAPVTGRDDGGRA